MAVEGIIANGVTEILKKLVSVVANQITMVWDFNDQLRNLQSTLNMILAVMEDAEKKQLSEAAVRLWMSELKSIAYDAEEILDDYSYAVLNKVHNIFSSSKPPFVAILKLTGKIKKINEKFNKIAKRKDDLGLRTIIDVASSSSSSSSHTMMMKNRETYSFVAANWKIVGRQNDKSTIIYMLLGGGGKHVSVIPIVGMGGLGKTTMAQLVFNDEAITKHFQLKIWICVSDSFDVKNLLKNIVNSTRRGEKYDDAATMDDIILGLQDALRGKKFLLVLDGVWNANFEDWNKLKTPLMVGAEGSKILVTTRSVEVASIMMDIFPPYPLGILNENDCLSLFRELAFWSDTGAVETPNLMEIGKEMVKRCEGLPLAVIFLGSLMGSKRKEEEWKIIRDTKLWHESREGKKSNHRILPSLRLSYDHLPSHLKQCFSYCSIFPKNTEIKIETLIQLWMAEGFLFQSDGTNETSLTEIGSMYFKYLLNNFFFQDVHDYKENLTCKMHDLVHDLAQAVTGNEECLLVAESSAHNMQYILKARRLRLVSSLDGEMSDATLSKVNDAKQLRSLFVNVQIGRSMNIGSVIGNNKRLHVLDLSGTDLEELPPSIGNLKHLRYLDLSRTNIEMLPKSISKLYHLQTLKLVATKIPTYPKGMDELSNLIYLEYTARNA